MKTMKRNRLRMLVAQRSITQPEANQLWRDYLRLFKCITGQHDIGWQNTGK